MELLKASQNGKATNPNKTEKPPTAQAKPETPAKVIKEDEPKALEPIADRLHRLNQLYDLQTKFEKLNDSETALRSFKTSHNSENSKLRLTDDNGQDFTTCNPIVIGEVIKLMLSVITAKRDEVAAKIIL